MGATRKSSGASCTSKPSSLSPRLLGVLPKTCPLRQAHLERVYLTKAHARMDEDNEFQRRQATGDGHKQIAGLKANHSPATTVLKDISLDIAQGGTGA